MTTATIYIERDGIDDIAVWVIGTYHRGFRGTYEQPPESAYVEITQAVIATTLTENERTFRVGDEVFLTPAEQTRAEEALYEAAMDDIESDAEAAAEARARRLEEE